MFWYDGKLVKKDSLELSINDPGLLYGATVFTTLRVYNQSLDCPLTNWKVHCHRLYQSLQEFGWQLPDWERLRQGAEQLLAGYSVLRIAIFPEGREWIMGRNLPPDLQECQQQGIVAWLADEPLFRRSLAAHKTGNYLGAWLALQKAQKLGAREAILVDEKGNWLETSTGNLWGFKNGCWWTPTLQGNTLPGIARSQLLQWLHSHNYPVKETVWNPEFVQDLEAIAYSNSVVEVIPFRDIINLDSIHLRSFNLVQKLRSCFDSEVR